MASMNSEESTPQKRNLMAPVLTAVALAMGVAVVTLSILGTSSVEGLVTLLGIGLFALALNALRDLSA
ncbi:MAG: hypothetical protein KBG20_16535 [Caldilineaceae bacterium]|nr:hypothetical protein [Caldilineaceae bacterium]MBP8108732.1 hypothetical protein [Caldilineaceae bacterium]MBP8124663.1 hypothetical protein [Caldilineaceae bacterium]MBP9073915.1 hypothetical protein [Caldilineaceae bacterium]